MQKPDGDEEVYFLPRCFDLLVSSVFQRNVSIVASHCEEIAFILLYAMPIDDKETEETQINFHPAVSISVDHRDSDR